MDDVKAWSQRIVAARSSGNSLQLRNTLLDAFGVFNTLTTAFLADKNYEGAEAVLKGWAEELDKGKAELLEKQLLYAHSRYQAACGYLAENRGLVAYFLHGDFVDAPRLLENAEIHHERAAELSAKVAFPAEAPPEARAMQARIVAMQRAEAQRVRGMRFLVQGEFEAETGALDRAVLLLDDAITAMQAGELAPAAALPGADNLADVLDKGQRGLNFIDFARALLAKTRSDAALLEGNFTEAADQQLARAEALRSCQSQHLRAGQSLNEGFARRLARDAYVATQRHDRLLAEARKRPKGAWLRALLFFVMAIGSAALFMGLAAQFKFFQHQIVFGLLLFFVMAIAGIGARLVEWKEAANWLRSAVPRLGRGQASYGRKEG